MRDDIDAPEKFLNKRIADLWAKLNRPGPTGEETFALLWELRLLNSSPSGCTEPVHEVNGVFQPDFEAVRKRRAQIERQLYRNQE